MSLKLLPILIGATTKGKNMLPIVAPFKVWFLYHSKVDFRWYRYQHTQDVCPFIAYCVIEFEAVVYLAVSYCGNFVFTANTRQI